MASADGRMFGFRTCPRDWHAGTTSSTMHAFLLRLREYTHQAVVPTMQSCLHHHFHEDSQALLHEACRGPREQKPDPSLIHLFCVDALNLIWGKSRGRLGVARGRVGLCPRGVRHRTFVTMRVFDVDRKSDPPAADDEEEQLLGVGREPSQEKSDANRAKQERKKWVYAALTVFLCGILFMALWASMGAKKALSPSAEGSQEPRPTEDDAETEPKVPEVNVGETFQRYLPASELLNMWESTIKAKNLAIEMEYLPRIGTSVEGRDISAIRMGNPSVANKTVLVTGGVHAREWISPAALLGAFLKIASSTDASLIGLFQKVRLLVVPLVNPDGYEFSLQTNRMWRKNRREIQKGSCKGVDLNRNFGAHYGAADASSSPCSETFRGSGAFSEPESTALRDLVDSEKNKGANFVGFIDFHSYGGLILYPPGWGKRPPTVPEGVERELQDLAALMSQRIKQVSGYQYKPESAQQLYPVGGSADDWMYTVSSTGLSFTIELRPSDENVCHKVCVTDNGFVLPASEIEPTSKDVMASILTMMEHVA